MNDVHPAPGSSARITRATLGGILAITLPATAHGQEKPYTQPGTATPLPPTPPKPAGITTDAQAKSSPVPTPAEQSHVQSLFHGKIPEAPAKGKFNLKARLR
jgi:hypothetical protein